MSKPGHNSKSRWQILAERNWADPAYRAACKAGRARATARIANGEGFLYLAEVVGTDQIKIGHALNPAKRMSGLKADYFKSFRLIKAIPASLWDERKLHRRLCAAIGRGRRGIKLEFYPRSILAHEAIPADFRSAE